MLLMVIAHVAITNAIDGNSTCLLLLMLLMVIAHVAITIAIDANSTCCYLAISA